MIVSLFASLYRRTAFTAGVLGLVSLAMLGGAGFGAERPNVVFILVDDLGYMHAWYKEVDAKFLQAKPGGPEPWRPES